MYVCIVNYCTGKSVNLDDGKEKEAVNKSEKQKCKLCNSCNMGARDLPDMYARGPQARGMRAYISGKSRAHMLQVMFHFRAWASAKQLKPDTYVY